MVSDIAVWVLDQPAQYIKAQAPHSLLRDFGTEIDGNASSPVATQHGQQPQVGLAGPALSGAFYGFSLDHTSPTTCWELPAYGPRFVLLEVANTTQAVRLYQPSTEHLAQSPQVRLTNNRQLAVYAWKYESTLGGFVSEHGSCNTSGTLATIASSEDEQATVIVGGSGNYGLFRGQAILAVSGPGSIEVASLTRHPGSQDEPGGSWINSSASSGAGPAVQDNRDVLLFTL